MLRNFQQIRHLNAWSASITRPHRVLQERLYPTVLVKPDGSTINFRYHEPRQIIQLPINIWTLSESERKAIIDKRKPKQQVKIVDDIEDTYDSNKYLKFMKKKK